MSFGGFGLSLAISAWLLGRRAQVYLLAPLLLIWSYAMLAGMSPSVVRAAIMGSIYLAALALGRPRGVLPALGLAAAAMVALEPRVLWNTSFQLSFAAMAGIAALSESIASKLGVITAAGPEEGEGVNTLSTLVLSMVSMTIAATLATLPIVAFYFERVSLVGIPATLLTLPALPLVLVSQVAAGAAGLLFQPAGQILGWLAWIATSYLSGIVAVLGRVPGASFETGAVAPILVWVYYGGLVVWYGAERYGSRPPGLASAVRSAGGAPFAAAGRVPSWVSLPAVAVAALIWIAAVSLPDGKLRVTFADVGQGDAALIGTPSGRNILIDGGPVPERLVRLLGNKLPFWDRSIDLVVLTHPHEDHVSGLTEALRKYEIENVVGPEVQYDSPAHEDWIRAVRSEGARVIRATAGQTIDFGDGVWLQVLNPPPRRLEGTASDLDNASVVVRMVYGEVSFLFTGDVFSEAEAWLVGTDAPIDSDVLKVAHHGSRSSSGEEFVEKVSPVAAVTSVGENNRHGHPHAETLETLHRHVATGLVFETKEVGYIEFVTDGRTLEVTTER